MQWDASALLAQLALGEDSRIEFKQVFFNGLRVREPHRDRLANELAAFGNSSGGALVCSVTDDGDVCPLTRAEMDALEAFVTEICSDSIDPPLPFLTRRLALPERNAVLIVEVESSVQVHRSPGGYYARLGSSARQLGPGALRRLFQRRGGSGELGPDETTVAGTGLPTLDKMLTDRFVSSRTAQPDETQLAKLGLLREDETGMFRATAAGVLLGTDRPDAHVKGAVIEAAHYRGTVLGHADQLDAATITGPLDRQIRDAVGFVRRNMRVAARKTPARVEVPQFSPRAVFEAIVNAVVHRDYTMTDSRIRLFMFEDRLEIRSPGALPNTLPIEAMRQRQATRNETIASLLRMLVVGDVHGAGDRHYFLEQRGEGVPAIFEETYALTGADPAYELVGDTELLLTLPASRPPAGGVEGIVTVAVNGMPLAGAAVLAVYPNKTWLQGQTDTFGRVGFDFHSALPITVFVGAPGHRANVVPGWRPPEPLNVELATLSKGGSMVIAQRTGQVPGLAGRLNPILDKLDRMMLYADNIAINDGAQQPVHFSLEENLNLVDVNGTERVVRFIDMLGESSVLEYESG